MGFAYAELGDVRKAIEHLQQAIEIGEAIQDAQIVRACRATLEELQSGDTGARDA